MKPSVCLKLIRTYKLAFGIPEGLFEWAVFYLVCAMFDGSLYLLPGSCVALAALKIADSKHGDGAYCKRFDQEVASFEGASSYKVAGKNISKTAKELLCENSVFVRVKDYYNGLAKKAAAGGQGENLGAKDQKATPKC
jgi:hypothetical protein